VLGPIAAAHRLAQSGPRTPPQRSEYRSGEEADCGSKLDHDVPPLGVAFSVSDEPFPADWIIGVLPEKKRG